MRTWILSVIGFCALLPAVAGQTPLAPPLPAGSTYYKGEIVSQQGVGVIGCTNAQFILADGSGCASASGGVSEIIPGTNITCTPDVLGNCIGNVTVNTTGSGPIPANATLLYTGTSINDDDPQVLAQPVTITAWSTSGGVTTVTNSGTNGFVAGQWINMRYATGWPACPSGEDVGTGCTIFQVLASGLSATQFKINTSAISAGTGSAGNAYSATSYLPFATSGSASMPSTALTNTVEFLPNPATIAGIVSGYTAFIHPFSPAITGKPGYLIVNNNNNDAGLCTAAATTEASYQTLFTDAHADGWIIVIGTPTGTYWSQAGLSCSTAYTLQYQVDQWLRTQGKNAVLAASATSTSYWDVISDLHSVLWDGGNQNNIVGSDSTLEPAGVDLASRTLASDIISGTGKTIAPNPNWYGYWDSSSGATVNTNLYVPYPTIGAGPLDFAWLNVARTAENMTMTDDGKLSIPGSINAGGGPGVGCPGDYPFCIGRGSPKPYFTDNGLLHEMAGMYLTGGGSNSTCWNTNGGVTACSASTPPIAALTNCLSVSCVGGSTYTSGKSYTNSSGYSVWEFVSMTVTGLCTGYAATISYTIDALSFSGNGVYNDCAGAATISFLVPAGSTFSATAATVSGSGGTPAITTWAESPNGQ